MSRTVLSRWAAFAGFLGLACSFLGCFRDPDVDKMKCLTECPSGYVCTIVDGVGRCCKPGDPLCNQGDASAGDAALPPALDSSTVGGDALVSLEGGIDSVAGASSEAGRATQVDADVAEAGDSAIDRPLRADDGAGADRGSADTPIRDDGESTSGDAGLDRPLPPVWDGASAGSQGAGGSVGTGGATNAGGAGGSGGIGAGGGVVTGGSSGAVGAGGITTGTGGTGTGGAGTGGAGTGGLGTGGSGAVGAGGITTGTGGTGTGGAGTGGSGTGGSGTGGSGTGGSGTGGSGTGGSGTGGSMSCPVGRICVQAPPAGWSTLGWMSTNLLTPCGSGLTSTGLFDLALRPTPEPAACGCACGSPVARCSATLDCERQGEVTGCWDMDGIGNHWTVNEQCMTLAPPPLGTSGGHTCGVRSPVQGSATCLPQGQQTVPGFMWSANAVTCVEPSDEAPSCGTGRVCAIETPSGAAGPCVAASGDVACPGAPYLQRSVLYQRFVDGRGCNPSCTCGNASATCQNIPTVQSAILLAPSCGGTPFAAIPPVDACQNVTGPAGAETWTAVLSGFTATATSECTPGGSSTPVGDVTVADPVTVCCAE